ncbi:kinesin-like protein KIF21A [Patiria miniata]|uniref:Kinesin motor domain-containing protein n=1 Tax=Patiria miniata TaxID=46514 RepID=A0A913ZQL5_PATMI|nr:kinesin-like protein KIF21A [Patiria miniata]
MPDPKDDSSVRVALRVRPQLARERIDMCRVCTSVTPDQSQVMLGQDRAFTFDHVFDMESMQHQVYNSTVHPLIEGCFDGYNATVFAYGQTGSGKTFTMGTGFEPGISEEQQGIVPRAVHHLFTGIDHRRTEALERSEPPPEFKIHAQFMELYNEEILDLFDSTRDVESSRNKKSHIKIHEDAQGGIYVVGVTTRTVGSEHETLQCLQGGALSRTTASTNMNAQSSRSHAIFTLHIKQQRLVKVSNEDNNEEEQPKSGEDNAGMNEFETLTAKFHFVDLAGSERLKRTGATGDRAKEGISINCGLLALGNVISALGDPAKKSSHVPYRDSKLTRLLQDSLGGNSQTLMIACVSPSDRDFMETLNTLRYANRAKNIKNVVVANQDKTSRQLAALRNEIRELQEELVEYKQGKRQINSEGVEEINDLFHENTMLQTEIENLRQRVKAMQETIDSQTSRISVLVAEQARARLSSMVGTGEGGGGGEEMMSMVEGYVKEIEDLRAKLVESESLNAVLRRKNVHESPVRMPSRSPMSPSHIPLTSSSADFSSRQRHYSGERIEAEIPENSRVASILAEARKQVVHDQEKLRLVEASKEASKETRSKSRLHSHSDRENESADEKEDAADKEDGTSEKLERDEDVDEDGGEEDGDDDEDELDEDDKESSDSDSEDEDETAQSQLQGDLADLACEINIKQRLIEELETSQRRLHTLKAQYEEKMMTLQDKIRGTEMERDKILANMGSLTETRTQEKAEKIRKEFEIKLKKLTSEKERMQKASKEHSKLLKNKSQFERQMKTLTSDLSKMKETKVKLMKQIREEQQRSRQKDVASSRAIQKLKKESLKHETRIKSLEAEAKQKEIVLKRRQEEVNHLRKQSKPMSDKVAGRVTSRRIHSQQHQDAKTNGPATSLQAVTAARRKHPLSAATQKRRHERKGTSEYSSKAAKQKWMQIDRRVTDIVNRRQTITHMERDMERYLHHRQRLSKKREKTFRRRDEAIRAGKDAATITELNDQIEGMNANIEYVQEQITECQANIMEVMEGKDEVDAGDAAAVIDTCCLQEAKYMLEHFLQLTINKGQHASQKESQVKELEAKLHQEEQNSFLQQQLLQHVLSGQDLDVEFDGLYMHPEPESSSSAESSRAPSPVESSASTQNALLNHANPASLPTFDYHQLPTMPASQIPVRTTRDKARRRTATPEELLYAGPKDPVTADATILLPLMESNEPSGDDSSLSDTGTVIIPPPRLTAARRERDMLSRPGQRIESPSLRRKLHTILHQPQPVTYSTPASSVEHTPDPSPPSSPPPTKGRSDNVFSRLTQSNSPAAARNGRGIINPVAAKPQGKAPLVCTYTAEGHTKAVLSVQATNDLLFSGSKDRTVKIWKLETGQELSTLSGHPNNVGTVRYSEERGLVFSVSTAYIRVWDIREPSKCIKTLSSSGHVLDSAAGSSSSRTVAMPAGETQINDIAVNKTGTRLYAAAGNIIRVWSLTNFQSICKLFGGPSAAIMCVAVDTQEDCDYVFAGSKDHYIKVKAGPYLISLRL